MHLPARGWAQRVLVLESYLCPLLIQIYLPIDTVARGSWVCYRSCWWNFRMLVRNSKHLFQYRFVSNGTRIDRRYWSHHFCVMINQRLLVNLLICSWSSECANRCWGYIFFILAISSFLSIVHVHYIFCKNLYKDHVSSQSWRRTRTVNENKERKETIHRVYFRW